MKPQAGKAACNSAKRVGHKISPAVKDALRQNAEAPQAPHIERNVNDPDVDIIRSPHSPGLVDQSLHPGICAPSHQVWNLRGGERSSRKHHANKNQNIRTDNRGGYGRYFDQRWPAGARLLLRLDIRPRAALRADVVGMSSRL